MNYNTIRAVLYARVSSDDTKNDGRNLAGQLEMGREYAQSKDYQIVAELAEDDRGASGATIDLPQLSRVREMAYNRQVDVLIVREIDRLSRSLAKQLIVEEELNRAGVSIEYVLADYEDTPEGRLSKHIRATIAEYERELIKERLRRGRRNKVKGGSVITRYTAPPYGYKVVKEDDRQILEINEDEAKIVRLIFQWYTVGDGENGPIGLRKIAGKLTEMGVPTPTDNGKRVFSGKKRDDGKWYHLTIWRILKKTTYIGRWQYSDITVDVPAIIDLETWQLAQERPEQNKQNSKRNRKHNYLLAGRVVCGKCAGRMEGLTNTTPKKTYQYYRCPATKSNHRSHTCNNSTYRVDRVDQAVWEWLTEVTSSPEYLKARLKEYQDHQDQVNEPIRRELATVDALLAENHSRRKRWLEMYEAGVIELDELKEKQVGFDRTISGLESRQAELEAELQDDLTDEVIEDLLEFAAIVREEIEIVSQDFAKRRRWIELMDVRVRLAVENGKQVAYASARLGRERTEKRLPITSTSMYLGNIQ